MKISPVLMALASVGEGNSNEITESQVEKLDGQRRHPQNRLYQ